MLFVRMYATAPVSKVFEELLIKPNQLVVRCDDSLGKLLIVVNTSYLLRILVKDPS
mgnify:CR=1 FL=1